MDKGGGMEETMTSKWHVSRLEYVSDARCRITFSNGEEERGFELQIGAAPYHAVSGESDFFDFVGYENVVRFERLVGGFWTACQEQLELPAKRG